MKQTAHKGTTSKHAGTAKHTQGKGKHHPAKAKKAQTHHHAAAKKQHAHTAAKPVKVAKPRKLARAEYSSRLAGEGRSPVATRREGFERRGLAVPPAAAVLEALSGVLALPATADSAAALEQHIAWRHLVQAPAADLELWLLDPAPVPLPGGDRSSYVLRPGDRLEARGLDTETDQAFVVHLEAIGDWSDPVFVRHAVDVPAGAFAVLEDGDRPVAALVGGSLPDAVAVYLEGPGCQPLLERYPGAHRQSIASGLADVACCAAEAVAWSLRLAGWPVDNADVLELYKLTADSPDAGASIPATLDAAYTFGLAGVRPVSFARADLEEPLPRGRILGLELPGPHTVLEQDGQWWTWGEPYDPDCFPDAVIEEAWAVTWP